jgi:hypothetical protein
MAATILRQMLAICIALMLTSCADLTVTHVTDQNNATVKGQRYYLPKPVIIAASQADGTVAVSIDYLPDRSHEYAIDTDSKFAAYTYQVATDIRGLLTEVEFKADTTAVGQQLAASAGTTAAQLANYQSAQILANQTAVNTAQAAVDTARVTSDAAKAALASDKATAAANPGSVTAAQLAADASASAQADAKLAVAQQALTRAQTTSQAVAANAAAASVVSTTGPSMGSMIGPAAWTGPAAISVPDRFPPVTFVVNDTYHYDATGKPSGSVSLESVQTDMEGSVVLKDTELEKGVKPKAQPTFPTASTALGPPSLLPPGQTIPLSAKTATFFFDRPVKAIALSTVTTDANPPVPQTATVKLSDDGKTVTVDISQLTPGQYKLSLSMSYVLNSNGAVMTGSPAVKFTVK